MKFDRNSTWYKQVQLLVRCLPAVFRESCFALKGGTAINLFERNLPRLSVDIDLVYLPNHARSEALPAIQAALQRIATALPKEIHGVEVNNAFEERQDSLRLIVSGFGATIKIELSPVLRGTVYPTQVMAVCPQIEDEFGYARVPVTSKPDLWAGKICAALDRASNAYRQRPLKTVPYNSCERFAVQLAEYSPKTYFTIDEWHVAVKNPYLKREYPFS